MTGCGGAGCSFAASSIFSCGPNFKDAERFSDSTGLIGELSTGLGSSGVSAYSSGYKSTGSTTADYVETNNFGSTAATGTSSTTVSLTGS